MRLMTFDEICARVGAVKKGKEMRALCPCHDDSDPSVAIKDGDSGVLVKCRAGCDTKNILAAWGLSLKDLFPEKEKGLEDVTYYTYTDRQGRQVSRKVRAYPKKFWNEHLEDGAWVNGLNGQVPDLYNVVSVIGAIKSGKPIWVVEGEKDADSFIRKGQVATTNFDGANKWKPQYTEALKGGKVVIVCDKDEPGYKHALNVYEQIRHGCKVKIVEPKEGKDATDHFVKGHGLEDFVEIGLHGLKQRLGLEPTTTGWTMANKVEAVAVEMLWGPYIPIGEVTFMAGDPGEGKSTSAQAIAAACTNGSDICGKPVKQGNVIFMSAEQSRASVTVPRFKEMGADLSKIALPDEDGEDGEAKPFVLDEEGFATLANFAVELKPVLIVVDTVTAYIEGARDFNSANQVREWMRRLAKIARQVGCAVLVLGHLNKNSNAKPINRIMGSMDFVGASRSVLLVGHDPDVVNRRAIIHLKSNVGPIGQSVAFSIDEGVFGWVGESELDADRMCEPAQTREAKTARAEAEQWVTDYLSENGYGAKEDMKTKAKLAGHGSRAFNDALHAVAEPFKDGLDGGFYWRRKV